MKYALAAVTIFVLTCFIDSTVLTINHWDASWMTRRLRIEDCITSIELFLITLGMFCATAAAFVRTQPRTGETP